MKRSILLIIMIYISYSFVQDENAMRTQFFPKVELKAERIPDKGNTWVFLLAGQSNMAGRGFVEPQDTIPEDRILSINKNGEIIIAKEPLHFYEPLLTGLDCGLSFGKTIIRHLPDSISVLLIPCAVGGSSISQWLGDSTFRNVQLLANFRDKVEIGKRYGQIKGVLWHQGENDATEADIPLYRERLQKLLVKFRTIAGNQSLPVLIGELGTFYEDNENCQKINKQIRLYGSTDNNSIIIKTSDLKEKGDKLHFNSESLRILGQRFADEYNKRY
jgi:hypothetical protein